MKNSWKPEFQISDVPILLLNQSKYLLKGVFAKKEKGVGLIIIYYSNKLVPTSLCYKVLSPPPLVHARVSSEKKIEKKVYKGFIPLEI